MSVFPSQETRMGVDDSVEKALMVGDNGTIMQITQRRGQGQITHGFDFRAPRLRGQRSKTHYSVSLFVIRIGDGLQYLDPLE